MNFYWPRRSYLSMSDEYAAVTYDPPEAFRGSSIRVPSPGPSSCFWIVPGTALSSHHSATIENTGE